MKLTFKFLSMALYAFLGLGLEMALLAIEPWIYGVPMSEWTNKEGCFHWIFTSIVWVSMCILLIAIARKKYDFDLFQYKKWPNKKQFLIALLLTICGIGALSMLWEGFKPFKEYMSLGFVPFLFQYLYYFMETGLVLLIIIFGQEFGERLTGKARIPWGGIVLSCTWGLVHILTQGLQTGIFTVFISVVFGMLYLLMNKNPRWSYLWIGCIFII